jgi:hypothetical protein
LIRTEQGKSGKGTLGEFFGVNNFVTQCKWQGLNQAMEKKKLQL